MRASSSEKKRKDHGRIGHSGQLRRQRSWRPKTLAGAYPVYLLYAAARPADSCPDNFFRPLTTADLPRTALRAAAGVRALLDGEEDAALGVFGLDVVIAAQAKGVVQ